MRTPLERWLHALPRFPGLQACGVWLPNQTTVAHSFAADFPVAALPPTIRVVADVMRVARLHRMPAERLRLQFEQTEVFGHWRRDQMILVVFATRDPRGTTAAEVDRMATAFDQLQP